jgi:hypothetical protein
VPTESSTCSTDTTDVLAATQALTEAAAAAGYAPSIRNTQPWRWRLADDVLDLYLDRSRVLEVTDPDARLATLSCGAALNHARIRLAAQGWRATVIRVPNPSEPLHLARLHADGRGPSPVEQLTVHRWQSILLRHGDHQPATGGQVADDALHAITTAVEAEGARLHVLSPDQIVELAIPADHAQRTEAAIAILHGHDDQPLSWLRAGEALSAGWLTAIEWGVSVVPFSAAVGLATSGPTLDALRASLGHPYLVLWFGSIDATDRAARSSSRLPVDQVIET